MALVRRGAAEKFRVCSSVGQSAPLIRVRPVVQVHPDPPKCLVGAIAQLGERLLCKQEVGGSIPPSSTNNSVFRLDILFSVIGPRKIPVACRCSLKIWVSQKKQAQHRCYACLYIAFVTQYVIKRKCLRLYGQANKRMWWMPRRQEAMKDVVACEKPRGAGKQALIRGCPNGETRPLRSFVSE